MCYPVLERRGRIRQFYFWKEDELISISKENFVLVNNITTNLTGNYSCQEFSEDTKLKGPRSDPSSFTGMFLRKFVVFLPIA